MAARAEPGGVRAARHPRPQPEDRRQAHLARLAPGQRAAAPRLGPGHRRRRRARRRRSAWSTTTWSSSWRATPRGDRVRLRLAHADGGRGAAPRRRGRRRRSTSAHASGQPVRAARALDGRLLARTMQLERPDVWTAHDGARRRAPADARHAERAARGRRCRCCRATTPSATAGRVRRAVRRPGTRAIDGGDAGLPPVAGRADSTRRWASASSATWATLAADDLRAPARAQLVAQRRASSSACTRGACRRRRCSTGPWRCASGSTRSATISATDRDKMLLVVGHAEFTPDGYADRRRRAGLPRTRPTTATAASRWRARCCPACAPGRCDAAHGKLPDESSAFAAYLELLARGDTQRLPRLQVDAAATRSGGATGVGVGARGDAPLQTAVAAQPSVRRTTLGRSPAGRASERRSSRVVGPSCSALDAATGAMPSASPTRCTVCVLNGSFASSTSRCCWATTSRPG